MKTKLFAICTALTSQFAFAQMPPPESSMNLQFGGNLLIIGIVVSLAGTTYLIHQHNKKLDVKPAISILVIGLIAVAFSFAL